MENGKKNVRTTLKQIAEETKLSVTIVSQVLNDKPCRVSTEKRELILRTAEQLNYRPNLVAVSLVKGSTNMIGLAISDIRNDFFSVLAKGVEDECQKNNWNVILCNSNDSHSLDLDNIRMLADKGASGIIFGMASETTEEMGRECIELLDKEKIPYILIDRDTKANLGAIVSMDHVQGGYLATDYLLRNGHRKIVCISGPLNLVDVQQRLTGVRKAFEEYGIPFEDSCLIEGRYNYESALTAVDTMFDRGLEPDAIFAFNDMMAIGAMKRLKERGYNIPEDISIIGYDNIFMDEFLEVPLTTVRQTTEEMGRTAAKLLIHCPEKLGSSESRVFYQPQLIERKSVKRREQ